MVLYVSNHGTISTHLYFNPYGMTNIPTYMIILCGPTCPDSYLKIYVHVVAFEFLGKGWCQHIMLLIHHMFVHVTNFSN